MSYLQITFILKAIILGNAVYESAPGEITQQQAFNHALAALNAATDDIPAEMLLGQAYIESRYTPTAVSRMENGQRMTGVPRWNSPPSYVSGSYYCGVLQTEAHNSWNTCLRMRDLNTGYATAVTELHAWLKVCRANKDPMSCALTGYAGGFTPDASAQNYPRRVFFRARMIRCFAYNPNCPIHKPRTI